MIEDKNNTKSLIHIKPLIEFDRLTNYIKKLLNKKYFVSKVLYERYIIANIIYDEKNRLVSTFKEYLIWNDSSEFMKKYYKFKKSYIKLNKYYEFYSKYSILYPNYIPLYESKYIYKNIHKKQKIIDLQKKDFKYKEKNSYKTRNIKSKSNKIFSSDVFKSIIRNSENLSSVFGVNKNNGKNNDSLNQFENVINSIEKYEKNEIDNEKENQQLNINKNFRNIFKELKNKNIIINNYYYNNSSILTKQSTIPSILAQNRKNYFTEKMYSILNHNNLIRLKKKKRPNIKNDIYNIATNFKNLISFRITNTISDDTNINKKINKYIAEDNYSLNYSLKKNKSINNNKNASLSNKNRKNFSSHGKISKNLNILKNSNNIQNYIKDFPKTSRVSISQNKKYFDLMRKLYNIKNHNKNKNKKVQKLNINLKEKLNLKKINYSLINKIFINKTNCLSEKSFSHFDKLKNKNKIHHYSNITFKKISKNNSRNEINKIKSNNMPKNIKEDANSNILLKTKIEKIKAKKINIKNRLYTLHKMIKLDNLTIEHKKNNSILQNTLKKLSQFDKLKTDREKILKNKYNEHSFKKNKINGNFQEKIKKIQKNNQNLRILNENKFIKKKEIKDNQNVINESDFEINSFFNNKNQTIINNFNFKKKNTKQFHVYNIKKKLFINKDIHKKYLSKKYYFTTENSLNYQEKNSTKDNNKQELNSIKKSINSKNNINNENNFSKVNNIIQINKNTINNIKKHSVIKIKGIQIKNFNTIYNKEKRESNSLKSMEINYKKNRHLIKIPKNKTNNIISEIKKKNDNNKIKQVYHLKQKLKINMKNNIFIK